MSSWEVLHGDLAAGQIHHAGQCPDVDPQALQPVQDLAPPLPADTGQCQKDVGDAEAGEQRLPPRE